LAIEGVGQCVDLVQLHAEGFEGAGFVGVAGVKLDGQALGGVDLVGVDGVDDLFVRGPGSGGGEGIPAIIRAEFIEAPSPDGVPPGLAGVGALAELDQFDLAIAELHRLDFGDEVLIVFIFIVIGIVWDDLVGEVFGSGKNSSGIGGEKGRPDVFAQIIVFLETGAGTGVGILRAVPVDVQAIEIGSLDECADLVGFGIDDLDGPPPEVVEASFPCFVGEIASNDLECPQRIAPKISLVAYFAHVLQDAGEEFFNSTAIPDRIKQHSDDVMNAREFPIDAGTESWIARFDGLADGGVVGFGEEGIVSGLDDQERAGDFGDGIDGADGVEIGVA